MRNKQLVEMIKKMARDKKGPTHHSSKYRNTLSSSGRYHPDVKLAEEDKEDEKKKGPDVVEINPTLNSVVQAR